MSDTGEETFPQLVSRVVDDAKEVARAEIALVRVQVAANVTRYRTAVLLFGAAATLAVAALVAASVGAILTLAPRIGIGWATLLVPAVLIGAAAICAMIGARRFKRKFVAPVPTALE